MQEIHKPSLTSTKYIHSIKKVVFWNRPTHWAPWFFNNYFNFIQNAHRIKVYLKNAPVGEGNDVLQDGDDPEAEQAIQSGQSKNPDCRFKQGKQANQWRHFLFKTKV